MLNSKEMKALGMDAITGRVRAGFFPNKGGSRASRRKYLSTKGDFNVMGRMFKKLGSRGVIGHLVIVKGMKFVQFVQRIRLADGKYKFIVNNK